MPERVNHFSVRSKPFSAVCSVCFFLIKLLFDQNVHSLFVYTESTRPAADSLSTTDVHGFGLGFNWTEF